MKVEESVLSRHLNKVHEQLRIKLKNFKHNEIQKLLLHALYEILPECEE